MSLFLVFYHRLFCQIRFRRKVREALEIKRLRTGPDEQNGLNKDNGDYVTTDTWKSLFDKINGDKKN